MTEPLFARAPDVIGYFASGSRVICSPAPQDTDEDYVIYTANPGALRVQLDRLGYTYSAKDVEKYKAGKTDPFAMYNKFDAYRHPGNDHNLIVPYTVKDFKKWKVATQVATALNLTNKADRIMLFRAIRSDGQIFEDPKEIQL